MVLNRKSKQRGITFIGLVFVGSVVAITGVILAQVFPTYIEYQSVLKAVNKAKDAGDVAAIRADFDRAASIDNIATITGKDLDVTKEGDRIVVSFAYQREIALVGPAWLTLKYTGRSK